MNGAAIHLASRKKLPQAIEKGKFLKVENVTGLNPVQSTQ